MTRDDRSRHHQDHGRPCSELFVISHIGPLDAWGTGECGHQRDGVRPAQVGSSKRVSKLTRFASNSAATWMSARRSTIDERVLMSDPAVDRRQAARSDEELATFVGLSVEEFKALSKNEQKTAYEISACLVGSEMCIRDRMKSWRRSSGSA